MKPPTVLMVQTMLQQWQLQSASTGAIIQKDIVAFSQHEAEEYVKCYASSHRDWTYQIVPLLTKGFDKSSK